MTLHYILISWIGVFLMEINGQSHYFDFAKLKEYVQGRKHIQLKGQMGYNSQNIVIQQDFKVPTIFCFKRHFNLGYGQKFMILEKMQFLIKPLQVNEALYQTTLQPLTFKLTANLTNSVAPININEITKIFALPISFQIKAGWLFVSLLNKQESTNLNFELRIKQGLTTAAIKLVDAKYPQKIFTDQYNETSDTYLGGICDIAMKKYQRGAGFTMGRMWLWKDINPQDSFFGNQFEKTFFNASGTGTQLTQTCSGLIQCTWCSPGINNETTCSIQTPENQQLYLLNLDFDSSQNEYFIEDSSGNQNHLKIKSSESQNYKLFPYKIAQQGYYYIFKAESYFARGFNFNQIPQFTLEVWLRKISDSVIYADGVNNGIYPLQFLDKTNQVVADFSIKEKTKNVELWTNTQGTLSGKVFNDIFQNDRWFQVSWSIAQFEKSNQKFISVMTSVDGNNATLSSKIIGAASNFFDPSDNQTFRIVNQVSVMYKSIKIYQSAFWGDEITVTKSNCQQISDKQGKCNSCSSDTKKCLSICKMDEQGPDCNKCHPFCDSCTGPNKEDCILCTSNSSLNVVLDKNFGNCTCISGYFYNETNKTCYQCHSNCLACYGPDKTQCSSCKPDKFFFPDTTCLNDCNDEILKVEKTNYFPLIVSSTSGSQTKICTKCHPYCSICSGPLNTQCSQCSPGYFLKDTNCYDVCPDGFQANKTSLQCEPCHPDCKSCTGPSKEQCTICTDITKYQQNGKCQSMCDIGFYNDTSKKCLNCNKACAQCSSKFASDCTACQPGFYLEWLGSSCKRTCNDGYYPDDLTNQCLMCHYSCDTCSGYGPDKCVICADGFNRRGQYCVEKCADSEFEVNGVCKSCDSKCSTCYGTQETQCYTCSENTETQLGYYYFSNSCLVKCPDGYYPDNFAKTCRKCRPECATCTSENYCTSCIYGPYQLNNGECTFFTCLDTQYRAIKPQLSCFQCDDSCLTCQGMSQFDCLSCKPSSQFIGQQCLTCSEQPGMTNPTDDTITGCVEICGDGYNYGYMQCDDGNLLNGDGCSSACTIEKGFKCTSGSKYTPSICMDNQSPTPRITFISSKNSIYIEFDEEVILQNELTTNNVQIQISGSSGQIKFDWLLSDAYKTTQPIQIIVIELSIYQSLKGSEKEQVSVFFKDPNIYKDATGNGIMNKPLYAFLNKYEYIDPETKAKLESAGSTSMLATLGAVLINLAISLIFGGSIAAMWTMVNTIQLISLFPLCNVQFPPITLLIFEKMLGSHGESTIIPNVFYDYGVNRPGSAIILEQALNKKFDEYGWKISNFLYLSGRKILMWTLLIVAYPAVWYMDKKYADKHKYCKLWKKVEIKFRYTLLLRGVIMSYVSMYLAFVLGIVQMNFETMENSISGFSAIAFGIILTYLPIQQMNILQRNYEKINTEKFMLSYSTIVKEVDLSHPIRYMYYPVFLIRRAVFAIQLVILSEMPFEQIIFMSSTAFAMMIYVIIVKPQKDYIMMVLTAVGEALILCLHLISILFLDENLEESKKNLYGWIVIIMIGGYILANWTIIAVMTISQLGKQWREFKKKRQLKKIKELEDKEYKKWKKNKMEQRKVNNQQKKQQMIEKFHEERNRAISDKSQSPLMMNKYQYDDQHQQNIKKLPTFDLGNKPFATPANRKSAMSLLYTSNQPEYGISQNDEPISPFNYSSANNHFLSPSKPAKLPPLNYQPLQNSSNSSSPFESKNIPQDNISDIKSEYNDVSDQKKSTPPSDGELLDGSSKLNIRQKKRTDFQVDNELVEEDDTIQDEEIFQIGKKRNKNNKSEW
ncbi:UNKNOWN [Stylonychia lemnae]|uniref:Fu domain containing protein n=1 Tax=Stylonychia lemnae TaxID=5949 RepID=A0A077ZT54_STYLE|nr:UNKNOWN [Stylonychia lemnae]|eukprot:CDW72739.1 UNKNOWN [Stylonychia lemnae]